MIVAGLFWAFLLTSCALMAAYGGIQERAFIGFVGLAVVATSSLNSIYGVSQALQLVMLIDLALLAISGWFIITTDKYWPIWFTGFHLNTIATEVASMTFPGELPGLYVNLAGVWALPALGLAAYGCLLDHRSHAETN